MLVVLRLALGWHFLYEGVWKIRHPDLFIGETEGFLSGARGPLAGIFNAMVPDIDGRQRLEENLNLAEMKSNDANGSSAKPLKLAQSWDRLRGHFVSGYRPFAGHEDSKQQLTDEAQKVYDRHVQGLNDFVKENGDKIKAHFQSLARYEEGLKTDPHTMFQRQRRWDEQQDLRKEAKGWIADLDGRENALKADLLDLLNKNRKSEKSARAKADKDTAAKAEKEMAAKAETKKPAEPETQKPAETEAKKAAPAATPAKAPPEAKTPEAKKPEDGKAKSVVEGKPSDPPKDPSLKPEKAKAKSKEAAEAGSEESGDAEQNKTVATDEKSGNAEKGAKEEKKEEKTGDVAAVKPQTAEKAKPAADATGPIDFSSLGEFSTPGGPFAPTMNPFNWKRIEQLAFLLTWSLFGIGLCLMLGLFTRPAALAGAGFMLFVVMSQPSYPGVYPLDPPQLGHALLVNKDFVEMIALLVIASTSIGRWTGLDCFVHRFLIKPFCKCCKCCKGATTEGQKA